MKNCKNAELTADTLRKKVTDEQKAATDTSNKISQLTAENNSDSSKIDKLRRKVFGKAKAQEDVQAILIRIEERNQSINQLQDLLRESNKTLEHLIYDLEAAESLKQNTDIACAKFMTDIGL